MVTSYLALDVGRVRIGLAIANSVARIAAPLPAITHDDNYIGGLQQVITENQISTLVVGWPRNLNGDKTPQTEYVAQFITHLESQVSLPVVKQDEAVTSVQAEAELQRRGKHFEKGDVDSLSAVYILEDYLADNVH